MPITTVKLTRIHIEDRVERGVVFAKCGYFKAIDWESGDGGKEGINRDPRVYQHFLKRWPELECEGCSATIIQEDT